MQLLNLTDCTLNYYWQADTCGRQKPRGFKVAVSKLTGKRSEIKGRDSCQDFKLYVTRCAAARRTCVYLLLLVDNETLDRLGCPREFELLGFLPLPKHP